MVWYGMVSAEERLAVGYSNPILRNATKRTRSLCILMIPDLNHHKTGDEKGSHSS
jgi:hypothetical protein